MFSRSLLQIGLRVCTQENRNGIKRLTPTLIYISDRRRDASTTTTIVRDNNKQKTIDDLDGPSFLRSLYWLFGKGYFQTAHQMQVSAVECYYSALRNLAASVIPHWLRIIMSNLLVRVPGVRSGWFGVVWRCFIVIFLKLFVHRVRKCMIAV